MYILGLDCGGTSSQALLTTTSGRVLGSGGGGPANYTVNGVDGVVASVSQAIQQALVESKLGLSQILESGVVLALGVSGASRPPDLLDLTQAFQKEGFPHVVAQHDATIAQLGALSGADGVIVIAGTGSIAYGVKGQNSARVGGWGYLLGDEGSALWIALRALQQVMWGYDGRTSPDLELELAAQAYFQVSKVEYLVPTVYRIPLNRGFIGGFSKTVTALASEGHELCRTILTQAGQELGRLAVAALAQLDLLGAEGRVGACGGVFSAGDCIVQPMQEQLKQQGAKQIVTLPDFEPVVGAVLLGAQALHLNLDSVVVELRNSLTK